MIRVDDLLGVRFTSHGRNKDEGFDCYGLAIEVSRRLGHELIDLWYRKAAPETFAENAEALIKKMNDRLVASDSQAEGDLIVFFDGDGNMVHVGVILEEGVFIHADLGGVMVSEISKYYRKKWSVFKWRQ